MDFNVGAVTYWLCDTGSCLISLYPSFLICKMGIIIITTTAPIQADTQCFKPVSYQSGFDILIGACDLQPVTQ